MNLAPSVVMLQQNQTPPGPDFSFFFMIGAIFLIFYFLTIRPQQRRQKEHEATLKSIQKGDSVVTSGGLHGKVSGVADDVLTVEIATLKGGDRVRVKLQRARVDSVQKAGAASEGKAAEGRGGKKS